MAAIDAVHPPDAVLKTINPILRRALPTPLGRVIGDFMLLRFTGHGRIWLQSRSPRALASWVHPFRPVESKNS